MKTTDRALKAPHARIIAAFYFGVLAIAVTILFNAFLGSMGLEQLVSNAILWPIAGVLGLAFGGLFGELIIHCPRPYTGKTFIMGALMVLIALMVFNLAILSAMNFTRPETLAGASVIPLTGIYAVMVFYSFVLVAPILMIMGGLAAVYLRGYLIYDLMHTHYNGTEKTSARSKRAKTVDPLPAKVKATRVRH